MKKIQQFLAKLREGIARDELPAVLEQLRILLDNSPKLEEAILQSARFHDIRKQIRLGLVSPADANLTQDQIRTGLLDLLRELEEQANKADIEAELGNAVSVAGSKNVALGSTISAGGDVHFGDIIQGEQKIPKILSITLPFFSDVFIGRDAALEAVHQKLFSGENLLLLVNGEGGIGKTTFAAKYWERYESEYRHLAWVFTGNKILDALLSLAPRLQLQFPETMRSEERLQLLLVTMAGLDHPCLLVLDNANDADELSKYYNALRTCPNFHILLTTRITTFEQAECFPIPPLKEDDAWRLFKKHYPGCLDGDEELFKAIRTAVGGNTLVLELLAKNLAVINTNEVVYPLADLLRDLQERGLFQLSQESDITVTGKGGGYSFLHTKPSAVLEALYDEVEMVQPLDEAEKQLLSNFAVLPAENIPYAQVKTLLQPDDVQAFSKMLSSLATRGWLEKSSSESGDVQYKISPVVQEITRHKNKSQLLGHAQTLINTLIEKLDYEPGTGHFKHASYEEAALYSKYAETVAGAVVETDNCLAILCERIGEYYKTTKSLEQALTFFEQCNLLEKKLNEAYPHNVEFKNNLAVSYSKLGDTHIDLGNLEQALIFFEQYNQLEKELNETYPLNVEFKNNLAISYSKLGNIYTLLGDLNQSLANDEEANRVIQELFEVNSQHTKFKEGLAISFERLGDTYSALGHFDKALSFFEKETKLFKELCEAYPLNITFKAGLAISCSRLGDIYIAQDKLDSALGLFQDRFLLFYELYEAHPRNMLLKKGLAISYSKIGDTYTALGNWEQSLPNFENETKLFKELYEADTQNVWYKMSLAVSYEKHGLAYMEIGNLEMALSYFDNETKLFEELYAANPQNVSFKNGLACSCSQLGRFYRDKKGDKTKAKYYFEQCYTLWNELSEAYPAYVEFQKNFDWTKRALEDL